MIIPTIHAVANEQSLTPIQKLLFVVGFFSLLIGVLSYSTKSIGTAIKLIVYSIGLVKWIFNKLKGKEI